MFRSKATPADWTFKPAEKDMQHRHGTGQTDVALSSIDLLNWPKKFAVLGQCGVWSNVPSVLSPSSQITSKLNCPATQTDRPLARSPPPLSPCCWKAKSLVQGSRSYPGEAENAKRGQSVRFLPVWKYDSALFYSDSCICPGVVTPSQWMKPLCPRPGNSCFSPCLLVQTNAKVYNKIYDISHVSFDESRFRHLSLLRTEGREDYDMSGNMSSKALLVALGGKLPAVVL